MALSINPTTVSTESEAFLHFIDFSTANAFKAQSLGIRKQGEVV
jgi:hypothetical protein